MYLGLFIFAGTIIKIAFDYLDKDMPINSKTIKSWILGGIVSGLFYAIQLITNLESNAKTNVSLAMYLIAFTCIGYLAPHMFIKIANFFDKKTDQKLTVTQTTTVEQTGTPPEVKKD